MITNLVIGSEGFVGKPFCTYLETLGEKVVHFDIKRDKNEDAREAQLPLTGVDRAYFLAWDVGGAKYLYREDSQFRQLDWNLKLLLNVMPQLQQRNVRFLFVSSQLAEEYDTVYGVTKRLGEVWSRLLKGVRVRLWNVYGPIEEPTGRTHVVSDFVYQAVFNRKIEMMTTGEEQRHFIHIDDVCRAFHLAMSHNLQGVYDVSSFEWIKVNELAQMIANMTGAELIPGKTMGSTPITPIRGKIPGWHAQVSLQDGLKRLISDMTAYRK